VSIRRAGAVAIAALLCMAVRSAGAQPAPYHHWRTLDTPHFHVHVPRGLEREGRVAGAVAERAYAQLAGELVTPRGAIDLVISDDADYSNGNATSFPTNRIVIFATPPVENQGLRLNEDWLALVITHELTHVFHLDRVRGVWNVAQHVFGRAPALFPNFYGPSWLTEGLAVYYESRFTQGGRLKDAQHALFARAAAAERRLPRLDQLSLGSPLFPGGTGAYAYGSLFVDYLARTRGDTTIRQFIERQSATLVPYQLNQPAKQGFGISFNAAFDAWRDSVQRAAGPIVSPLAGWRELTHHGYNASNPRWLSDSVLVYVGGDGRSTNAAYRLGLDGARARIGRRTGLGANVPLADGGLLYAQLDFTSPSEVRSDLYVQRDGRERQLTHGLRVIQPDVRARDGAIVAVQLAATRSSLVLLDSAGRMQRMLARGGPDETWSEPRWSRDGTWIAAVRRTHGGRFALVTLDSFGTNPTPLLHSDRVIASPAWKEDDRSLVYTVEENGAPVLRSIAVTTIGDANDLGTTNTANGVFTPDVSTSGMLAASTLRADGYHVGIAPQRLTANTSPPIRPLRTESEPEEPLAPGDYHSYSGFSSALPRYWYPLIERSPGRGTRLGFMTSGQDVIGRHFYDAYAAVPTTGSFPIAGLSYRYAGFRRPYVNVALSQDFTSELDLLNGGTTNRVGTLLRRSRDAQLAATWARPRVRSYSAVSLGAGAERRDFMTDPGEFLGQLDTAYSRAYVFPRVFVSAQWSNVQRPPLSISAEDGVSLAFTVRERMRADDVAASASSSVVGVASAYKSLDFPGFAHHVLSARIAGGLADRRASSSFQVGGTSGSSIELVPGYTVGEGRRTFGVRGFPSGSIYGTQAASASLEYRAPLVLSGRGFGLLPFFFDRSSVTAFADAASATCAASPKFASVCAPSPRIGRTIASAGVELGLSAAVLDWDRPQTIRLGIAVPVAGAELVGAHSASPYVAFGLSF
jgi:hypothetical protein